MAAPPNPFKLDRASIVGAPSWIDALADQLNPVMDQTRQALSGKLSLAQNLNAALVTTQVVGAATPWTEIGSDGAPAFQNGWSNLGGTWETVGYRIDSDGWVWLKGWATGGSSTLFTLPAGYAPALTWGGATEGNSAFATWRVFADGRVVLGTGSATGFSLNGIRFQAAAQCAAPPRPVGTGWPASVTHGLATVSGVEVLRAQDLDLGSGSRSMAGAPRCAEWSASGTPGTLLLNSVLGLSPGRRYSLTVLVWG